jgi:hypothetical protein
MAGSDTSMTDAYTVVRRENALILSSDKDKQVSRHQPITKKDIPDWVIRLLDGINGELGRMDALIQEARQRNFEIQTALPELAQAYEGLINRQNEIYDAVCQGVEKMERAQFEKHSDIVIQSQVFAANVQAAFVVMKAQSTEDYEELRSALGEQIQRSGKAWGTLSTLLDNRERAQERLALQVHTQSQELAVIQLKAKEDGERMSGLYAKSRTEVKKMQEKADKAERERKAAERKMKKDFERKFKEFTRALQTKLSDERTKRSVRSLARSVLTPKEGDTKPVEQGFRLRYTVSDGVGVWVKEAVTPEPNGNGDGAGGVGGDPPGDSESSSSSSRSSSSSDSGDDLPPLPPPAGTDYSESPSVPPQVPPQPRTPNPSKKQKIELPYKFKGDPTDKFESYRHWITGVDRYLRYFKDDYNDDDDKIIFVGTILREKALGWYNNREKQLRKHFQVDTWSAFTSAMEERFIDPEEEAECLQKMNKLQYKGDIQDYIIKMEDLNYHICLSGIAWRQALHSGLNEEIKDRISFSKITPDDDAEYEVLLKQVGRAYERRLQEKHQHNDHKPKDKKNNKRKRDDDGDDKGNQGKKNFEKGSDSKKPRTEKKGPKPVNTDKAKP